MKTTAPKYVIGNIFIFAGYSDDGYSIVEQRVITKAEWGINSWNYLVNTKDAIWETEKNIENNYQLIK